MNFLGYPATIGSPLKVPYIGTDFVSTPIDVAPSVSEKMVTLPWALMPITRWELRTLDQPELELSIVKAS